MSDPIVSKVVALTVDTSAYATGDSLCTNAIAITEALPPDRPWGVICGVKLISDSLLTSTTADVYFYDALPATTFTANGAHSVATADQDNIIDAVPCTVLTSDNNCTVLAADRPMVPFRLSGTVLYASIAIRGTPTIGVASDVKLRVDIMQQS